MIFYNATYKLRKIASGYSIILHRKLNNKYERITTGHKIPSERMWDARNQRVKDTCPDHDFINKDLAARKHHLNEAVLSAQLSGGPVVTTDKDFYSFVEGWIKEVGANRSANTLRNYNLVLRMLKKHREALSFEDLNTAYLASLEVFIRGRMKKATSTYIGFVWDRLKKWIHVAIQRGLMTSNPFDIYEVRPGDAEEKDYLTQKELSAWLKYARKAKGGKRQAALYFLLGCYTGLRVSDWYAFDKSKIVNGEIRLRATKNKEWVCLPVLANLKEVISMIHEQLTLPEQVVNRHLKEIAAALEIGKHLSTHCGRKTFAVTMCADRGISSETCAELMGITISTCVKSYYRVTAEKIKRETRKAWGM